MCFQKRRYEEWKCILLKGKRVILSWNWLCDWGKNRGKPWLQKVAEGLWKRNTEERILYVINTFYQEKVDTRLDLVSLSQGNKVFLEYAFWYQIIWVPMPLNDLYLHLKIFFTLAQQVIVSPYDSIWLGVLKHFEGLPWWVSGKESACSAGDTGLIPVLGGSHMPWGNQAPVPQLLKCLEPASCNRRRHCKGKPTRCSQGAAPARQS